MHRSDAPSSLTRRKNPPENDTNSTDNKTMDSIKPQLYRKSHKFSSKTNPRSANFCLLYTSVTLFLVFLCYVFLFPKRVSFAGNSSSSSIKYGVLIDGGSTGTRIHVFGYESRGGKRVFEFFGGKRNMKVNPGLSAYAEEPEKAGEAVAQLVEFARKNVPHVMWKETEIRLMATAGLRLLDKGVQDRILETCRRVLRGSGFLFKDDWASVISGSDEGVYAWVIANYALGTLGGDPKETTGIIELGGASAQVTFVSDEPMPPEYSRTIKFGNFTYNLYSHSLLQFGQNVALDLLRDSLVRRGRGLATGSLQIGKPMDPCTPRGYKHDNDSWKFSPSSLAENGIYLSTLHPNGNFSECRSASLALLQEGRERCAYQSCYIGSAFVPKLQGRFLATENFFYTSKFFGLAPRAFLSNLMVAGQQFCEEDWSNLKRKYHALAEEDLVRYCFSSAYIVALLHDSLGIPLDDERIGYANQVQNIPLDWALGAFISQNAAEFNVQHSNWLAAMIGDNCSTLLMLLGVAAVLIFMAWLVAKWRKPQLKTIYDLEKGKYIVTRIGRYS